MQLKDRDYYTPEEYLELEINSEERNEYIDGEIITMTGAKPNHNQIALNLGSTINFYLKGKPYQVFIADQRLWIPKRRIYTYPDVMITSLPLQFQPNRKDTIINPLILIEVLSQGTKNYDKDEKFAAYRTIENFKEYVLIDQYKIKVEHYVKTDENKWLFSEYNELNQTLSLTNISLEISLTDIYDKVDFNLE